jgi:hypothetical protein
LRLSCAFNVNLRRYSKGTYAPTAASRELPFAARHGYLLLQKDVHAAASRATAALRREGLGHGRTLLHLSAHPSTRACIAADTI